MSEDLRFLFIEDRADDVELEERELRAAGLRFVSRRIDNVPDFRSIVPQFDPHLIFCDYSLPGGVDGMSFLHLARELCPGVPFVFVSGTMGEDRAVEALKNGAADYVLKDRLGALAVRVRRVLQDAEERRRRQALEEQLRQAQKVEAIGKLAGGVAHDFNNLLTLISGYTELSLDQLATGHPLRPNLEEIRLAAERATALTRQLLAFARRQMLEPTVLDLNDVVSDTERMLRRLIGENVDLEAVFEPDLWRVRADRGQIEQVIVNLSVNARDAMPHGGRLTLETSNVVLGEDDKREHPWITPGEYVRLCVTDTGTGMDEQTLEHIFEPFFTTKPPGVGTGLGLATVYGILKQSGGYVWVETQLGRGTTFKVHLPRVDAPLGAAPAARQRATKTGHETILLVEDDPSLRSLTTRMLEMGGYTVLDAGSGLEALELLAGMEGTLHLVVTDVVMPGMSGTMVAEEARRLRPGVKVLYITGYVANTVERHGIGSGAPILAKPFTPAVLLAKVREVLDAS